jgi:hypothetical protein
MLFYLAYTYIIKYINIYDRVCLIELKLNNKLWYEQADTIYEYKVIIMEYKSLNQQNHP